MKNLDIKYASASNFLCFGNETFKIDFNSKGRVVLIEGINSDVSDGNNASSNGAGKSSIPEIIVYTLFGKTIKHPKKIGHKDVINNSNGKKLRTEVRLGNFRIVRTRKPDSLRVWQSDEGNWDDPTEITLGGQPATQQLIEEKVGLNYETFVNVVVFTDNSAGSFLECDASTKRDIVESLLSLEKYRSFAESAKSIRKQKKDEIKSTEDQMGYYLSVMKQASARLEAAEKQEFDWRKKIDSEIESIKLKISQKENDISSLCESNLSRKYHESMVRSNQIKSELPAMEQKRSKLEAILEKASEKANSLKESKSEYLINIREYEAEKSKASDSIVQNNKEIRRLKENAGATCKYCFSEVQEENFSEYTDRLKSEISLMEDKISNIDSEIQSLNSDVRADEEKINATMDAISQAKKTLAETSSYIKSMRNELEILERIEKPDSSASRSDIIKGQITELVTQLSEKKKEAECNTPFKSIIESLKEDIKSKSAEIESNKSSLAEFKSRIPYYEFWQEGFGDSGIRRFVIEGIVPALNAKIAHWLNFLIDGKISLEFNNELEETIQRSPPDGDPFVYHAMSGGERRRLNLAVSQAFAHVMMLNCGMCPSLVFLDEVTTNIDQMGVVGVYNMIMELSRERQVFITTHDQNLLDMLAGCELVTLEKRGGFTKVKN